MKYTNSQIEALIKGIEDGTITEWNLPKDYYNALVDYLKQGLFKGFGATLETVAVGDVALLEELVTNMYMFSGGKTFQIVKEISGLLVDEDGVIRSSREFNKLGRETYDTWNDIWGRTEYNTAIAQGDMAAKWKDIESQKDVMPNLKYSAIGDACIICAPLDGMVAPVDSPIWDKVAPINHFNCFKEGTKVLTSDGFVEINKLVKSDTVIGGSGKVQNITGIHVNNFDGELVSIRVKNNSISSTKNHRFLTSKGWVMAENICIDDIIIQNIQIGFFNKFICAINNLIVILCHFTMPIVRKWKAGMINALNTDIKIRQMNVNKPSIYKFIANTFNSFSRKKIKYNLLTLCKSPMVLKKSFGIVFVGLYRFFVCSFSNIQIKHWVFNFHSFGRIRAFTSQCRITPLSNFFQFFRGVYFSFCIPNPLHFYSFASAPCFNFKIPKQSHKGSIADIPQSTNLLHGFTLNKVSDIEGFTTGAPLDSFDSINSFLVNSFWHRKLVLVNKIESEYYKGQIYNLSVNVDESYITNVGVVHNCKCLLLQVGGDVELTKNADSIHDKVVEKMDGTFINNVGKSGEVFTKDHPYFDVAKEYKAYAKNNFDLPLPKFAE